MQQVDASAAVCRISRPPQVIDEVPYWLRLSGRKRQLRLHLAAQLAVAKLARIAPPNCHTEKDFNCFAPKDVLIYF